MNGILVASDQTLEWILPWWWEHYRYHNHYPVAFIDLGLSFGTKKWCKERGELIPLTVADFIGDITPQIAKKWEQEWGKQFWESRNAWFKKPFACLKSPFPRTLWIDIDCEIRASLAPLFEYVEKPSGWAMAKEQIDLPKTYPIYNSGVIAFRQHHLLLQEWAEACVMQNQHFRGDQEIFSHLIAEKGIAIDEILPLYNWSRCLPERRDAIIQHWHGHYGKWVIRSAINEERTT